MNPNRRGFCALPRSATPTGGADDAATLAHRTAAEGLIWPFSRHLDALLRHLLERMSVARLMLARAAARPSSAISRKISWNICRGMATSAIWKAT